MKFKNILFIISAIVMCVAVVGCSPPASNNLVDRPNVQAQQPPPPRQPDNNQPISQAQQPNSEQGFQQSNSELSQQQSDSEQSLQQSDLIVTYPINDTGQVLFYNNTSTITEPKEGDDFYGQDAQYTSNEMSFSDNGDGTVTDNVTGLMWTESPLDEKLTWDEAMQAAEGFTLAGYDDWRLPTIKELYSLIDFSGEDPSGGSNTSSLTPFINTDYFDFEYGDESAGERIIDSQYASSTKYVSTQDGELAFGVNFADGRIKGYGLSSPNGGEKTFVVMFVRGDESYGQNNFIDNSDGTITDLSTGLMWMQSDSGYGMDWEESLEWSESLEYAGYDDWRLPDAKELQSIVDYSRSPDTTGSAAISALFNCTAIEDEGGNKNYGFYWTGTTHANSSGHGFAAVYIAFGEALGFMQPPGQQSSSNYDLLDVHGAGAQRSDPKTGDASDYPYGHGPQGDVRRIDNLVRCCRSIDIEN